MTPTGPQPPSRPPAVVIIDDEARYLDVIARMLTLEGLIQVVGTATSCEEALALLDGLDCPDLVLIDVQMPGQDGFQTAHALLQAKPDLKVVLTSGTPEDAYPELSVEVGAVGFLPKRDLSAAALRVLSVTMR